MNGKLLSHKHVQTTASYAHLPRHSIQNAAARITEGIGGKLSSAQNNNWYFQYATTQGTLQPPSTFRPLVPP